MITDVPVAPGANVTAAHGGVDLVIDVLLDQLVEDRVNFDNIKDTSVIVEIRFVTFLLVERGYIRCVKY